MSRWPAVRHPCLSVLGVAVAAALLAGVHSPAAAGFSFRYIPQFPHSTDVVVIEVTGGFPDLCWLPPTHDCGVVVGNKIWIGIYAFDNWTPESGGCFDLATSYGFRCAYGPLPAGEYGVEIVEYHQSLRTPDPIVRTGRFYVSGFTPARPATWSRLRALYR
jgi:hypothetical protein